VDEEDPVELGLRWQAVEPVDLLIREPAGEELVDLHHLGPVLRRLLEPTLAVAADPGGVLEEPQPLERLQRPRAGRAVVPAKQPAVDSRRLRVSEHLLQGRQVAVDVVQQAEHRG
jgi:hypothetical protein